jgi:hypothetical protein
MDFGSVTPLISARVSTIALEPKPGDWIDATVQALKLVFGDKVPPMALRTIGWVALTGLALIGLWGVLWILSKIKILWTEQFRPMFYNAEVLRRTELRRRFADHVESEIRRLNNLEQWSDHRFAELEAEVQAEGTRRAKSLFSVLAAGERTGIRQERSLSAALRTSKERLILVEGDPGSGKSVALRHVTQAMAWRSARAKTLTSIIPVYVNLKELVRDSEDKVGSDLIRLLVLKTLNRPNNRDIDEFLETEFDAGLQAGTWLFLFDSFDEIPEVLSSVEADSAIREYTEAISDFLGGLNACRGVVASRQFRGPGQLGWSRFRILSLSSTRKCQLIRKAALERDVERSLLTGIEIASEEIRAMAANPMFLGLLVEHVRGGRKFPANAHVVFEQYVQSRLDRDEGKISRRFGLTTKQVRDTAESAAFCMAADSGLGLSPASDLLTQSIGRLQLIQHDGALKALEFIKLARAEKSVVEGNSELFTFAHRRFQEYFATCVVLRDAHRVDSLSLLTDGRWRETAVVLCQTQAIRNISDLLQRAERLVHDMADSPQPKGAIAFNWPPKSLHLLGLLQEASGRKEILSDTLRAKAADLLASAVSSGTTLDKIWALEVAGVCTQPALLSLLRTSFSSRSRWLREVAFRQASRLITMPNDVAEAIRIALIRFAQAGSLRRERVTLRAQLSRLDGSPIFLAATELLISARWIDSLLWIGFGIAFVRARHFHGPRAALVVLVLLTASELSAALTILSFAQLREVRFRDFGSRRISKLFETSLAPAFRAGWFLQAVYMRAFFLAALCAVLSANITAGFFQQLLPRVFGTFFSLPTSLLAAGVFLALWLPSAVFAVKDGRCTAPIWWPFLPIAPLLKLGHAETFRRLGAYIKLAWKGLALVLLLYGTISGVMLLALTPIVSLFRRVSDRFPLLREPIAGLLGL